MDYMKILGKAFAIVALAAITSQAAFAHDDHKRWDRGWDNGGRHNMRNSVNYQRNRRHDRGYRNGYYNGSYVDTSVGADGYPAFMGGYRPR